LKICAAIAATLVAIALAGCSASSPSGGNAIAVRNGSPAASSSATAVSAPAASLARAMQARGVKITGLVVYDAKTDPNNLMGRQGEYTSKVEWPPKPGDDMKSAFDSIEAFGNLEDAQARLDYLKAFRAPFGDGYDYLAGTAILRLSAEHTPAEAAVMERAFKAVAS
jgi:hypothetical protein